MLEIKNIAIIVPFHKDKKMLELSLHTLSLSLKHQLPEILIIANNEDASEIDISLDSHMFQIYKIHKDIFWPGAINYGAQMTDKKYLIFCDPDVFYLHGWLDEMIQCFNEKESVGAVGAKLINPLSNRIMDFGMGYNYCNTIHISKGLPFDHPFTQADRKVQAACGAVMLTSHELFETVGGIDTSMPYIYCDNDYSIKISERGYNTWVAAKALVYHKGNTDSNNSKYQKYTYLREDSKALFYAKNINKRKVDLDYWLRCSWEYHLNNTNNKQKNYCLFDFCTLPDHEDYVKSIIDLGIRIVEKRRIVLPGRDMSTINLCNYIESQMINSTLPFLYFIDDFTSLTHNKLWMSVRDISRDLIMDRQCNILSMTEVCKIVT